MRLRLAVSLLSQSHHETDGFNLELEDLIFSQVVGLVVENLC